MKSIKIMLAVSIFPFVVWAGNPPEKVVQALNQKFPNIQNVHWGKESKSEWEAEFMFNGVKTSANFLSNGQWLETETKIPNTDLPKAIEQSIQSKYKGLILVGVDKIETSKNETLYEAELKSGVKIKEVVFNPDGTIYK
jgi:hypothetical protein